MLVAKVTHVQFVEEGELSVVHLPTGNRYEVYPASNPDDFYVVCTTKRHGLSSGELLFDLVDIRNAAHPILQAMLRRRRMLQVVR